MTTFTETLGMRAGEFLVSEANGHRSREHILIPENQTLVAGQVLGKITTGAATAGAVVGTGNGTMGAITLGKNAKPGVYTLRITEAAANAGAFEVTDPDGDVVGTGNVGSAFTSSHLSFTLADGSTDFAAGATIPITVAAGLGTYVPLAPSATNGSQIAAAILWEKRTTGAGETKRAVGIVRDAEFNADLITWPEGISGGDKTTALAQLAAAGLTPR
ncbi:MAG TPA: head decoration protein [Geminicoccus sp.]|uniref:head decoration protein n=1 Tax=Geminicoccus sp. TaxID=2024832 RepID=UPI002CD53888|nr:head decoration protein [Geminicoccus sp.]HWL70422.1 head decoration protein [Geminicoccus sp.]